MINVMNFRIRKLIFRTGTLKTKRLKTFKTELWKLLLNSQKIKGSFDIN